MLVTDVGLAEAAPQQPLMPLPIVVDAAHAMRVMSYFDVVA